MTDVSDIGQVNRLIQIFIDQARQELEVRLKKWQVDPLQSELQEVVGALLARQVSLARQFAASPTIWTDHVAPVILRAMADVYISLAWVLRDPIERSRKFVLYGLAQAKLQLEQCKAQIGDRTPTAEEKTLIETLEAWMNAQPFTFITDVNLRNWSGITTLEMAEEAGCMDFYNFVYNPFSACSHSTWSHIGRYNLKQCTNPLHQYHKIPTDPELPIDLYYLYSAAKCLKETFSKFDEKIAISVKVPSAFEHLCAGLEKIQGPPQDKQE